MTYNLGWMEYIILLYCLLKNLIVKISQVPTIRTKRRVGDVLGVVLDGDVIDSASRTWAVYWAYGLLCAVLAFLGPWIVADGQA